MSGWRLPLGLLAPISLVLLVLALGALQYRWVGQVSEAEREQLKQSLDRRAREFADDFDRELGRAYQAFRPPAGFTPETPERFARQYQEWLSTATFPGLVKHAYFVRQSDDALDLLRFDPASGGFQNVDWPEPLIRVRDRIALTLGRPAQSRGRGAGNGGIMITTMPVVPDVPALVIAEMQVVESSSLNIVPHMANLASSFTMAVRGGRNHVILELDRDFISATILPALTARHFPEEDADRVRISVVDGAARVLHARGIPADTPVETMKVDASAPFFGLRVEAVRGFTAARQPGGSATIDWSTRLDTERRSAAGPPPPPPPPPAPVSGADPLAGASAIVMAKPRGEISDRLGIVIEQHAATVASGAAPRTAASSGWTVLVQHGAGSLDAAVERARRRNLWLSFGILGVLAASAGLVMVNARRSEKLAAQQLEFVATVSHELRTPVAVIRSAAQNLSAGVVHEPEQARRYGELIESEGRRLTDMVEQVLEYAGLSDSKRAPATRPIDVGRVIRGVVAASETLPEAAGITIDARIDDNVPAVMADEDAIRRALLNLVGNALKYGADGSWIGISVARGTGRDDGYVSIAVSDRGRGIPPEDLPHLFDPFYRGAYARDRQIHGNGLGLSLVKRIVVTHGGRVSVRSAPGEGATFTIHLPIATAAVAGTPVRADSALIDPERAEGHSA
jgi:signal transduction histidine kinase